MKKIAKSIITILFVSIIAIGATKAYFTDNITVSNNTFTSGKLDLVYDGTASTAITVSNMDPGTWFGTSDEYQLTVENSITTSTLPAKYRFRQIMDTETLAGTYNLMNARVYRMESSAWSQKYDGALSAMLLDPSIVSAMGNLLVGATDQWKFEFQLDPSAANSYQGQTTTFTLYVDGTQSTNPGWV